jgi:hypothetical protein
MNKAIDNYISSIRSRAYSSSTEILGYESPDFLIGYLVAEFGHQLRDLKLTDKQLAILEATSN